MAWVAMAVSTNPASLGIRGARPQPHSLPAMNLGVLMAFCQTHRGVPAFPISAIPATSCDASPSLLTASIVVQWLWMRWLLLRVSSRIITGLIYGALWEIFCMAYWCLLRPGELYGSDTVSTNAS